MLDKLLQIVELWSKTIFVLLVVCYAIYLIAMSCWHFPYIAIPIFITTGTAALIQYKYKIGFFDD